MRPRAAARRRNAAIGARPVWAPETTNTREDGERARSRAIEMASAVVEN